VAKMFRMRGFLVLEAADGSTAIDLLRDRGHGIDVILRDLTGADSREVAEQAHWIRPDTKIVITSAYGQEAVSRLLQEPQVAGYIRKPFQAQELIRLLSDTALGNFRPQLKENGSGENLANRNLDPQLDSSLSR
jgi:DNA-binding NarL/FixJ family response regulator